MATTTQPQNDLHSKRSIFFLSLGSTINENHQLRSNYVMSEEQFKSLFGVSSFIASLLWKKLTSQIHFVSKPKHLLWGLLFLKVYGTEAVHCQIVGCCDRTFRKWSWYIVKALSMLSFIKLDNRINRNTFYGANCSIDGVDFQIQEPISFDKKWFSHKFKGPGLRYEVGISLYKPNIVWAFGPFPAGKYPDNVIFGMRLNIILQASEKVICDNGYNNERVVKVESLSSYEKMKHSRYRARHESFNGRLKTFHVLQGRFRHKKHLHHF